MDKKDADEKANSVDPDQTAPSGANSLHCLCRLVCRKIYDHCGKQTYKKHNENGMVTVVKKSCKR